MSDLRLSSFVACRRLTSNRFEQTFDSHDKRLPDRIMLSTEREKISEPPEKRLVITDKYGIYQTDFITGK